MTDTDTRSFGEIAEHARAAQEQLAIAQGRGYIAAPDYANADNKPKLPGFRNGLSTGSADMRAAHEQVTWREHDAVCNHVRFLEHVVERLACQVAEMAEQLAAD